MTKWYDPTAGVYLRLPYDQNLAMLKQKPRSPTSWADWSPTGLSVNQNCFEAEDSRLHGYQRPKNPKLFE